MENRVNRAISAIFVACMLFLGGVGFANATIINWISASGDSGLVAYIETDLITAGTSFDEIVSRDMFDFYLGAPGVIPQKAPYKSHDAIISYVPGGEFLFESAYMPMGWGILVENHGLGIGAWEIESFKIQNLDGRSEWGDNDLRRSGDRGHWEVAAPVPEPASWLMFIAGIALLSAVRRKRKR